MHGSIINNYRLRERGVSFYEAPFLYFGIELARSLFKKTKTFIMKALITAFVLALTTGAFAQKVTESNVTLEQQPTHTAIKGVVSSFDGKSCNLSIQAYVHGETIMLYPTNLPSKFNQDGLNIVFDYYETDDKLDQNCGFESAIHMSNVKNARPTKVK